MTDYNVIYAFIIVINYVITQAIESGNLNSLN